MPRIARPVFAGAPHHITQRGNRREDVFFDEADRVAYLAWLGEYCVKYKVKVLAYCLMTNHVHVVAVPGSDQALERVFRPLHTRYAQRVNRAKRWKGHLWQGRFLSSALDDTCGRQSDTWNATLFGHGWYVGPRMTHGRVRRPIVVLKLT